MFENIFVQPAAHDAGCALGAALSLYYGHTEDWVQGAGNPAQSQLGRIADVGRRSLRKLARAHKSIKPVGQPALPLPKRPSALEHLNWGTDNGGAIEIGAVLDRWRDFITFERVDTIEKRTAELIATGNVIGWVQGRSEFGPRALGNRTFSRTRGPPKTSRSSMRW